MISKHTISRKNLNKEYQSKVAIEEIEDKDNMDIKEINASLYGLLARMYVDKKDDKKINPKAFDTVEKLPDKERKVKNRNMK